MTTDNLSVRTNRIQELDGLRAFAVLCVMMGHMYSYAGSLPKVPYVIERGTGFLVISGVHIFFVISGFIITNLLLKEKLATGEVSLKAFYVRRFFRIIPPFAIYLGALLVLRAFELIAISNENLLWSAVFLGNVGLLDGEGWFVGHTWSLSVEEQFYLLFPPLFCRVFGFRNRLTSICLTLLYALCVLSAHFTPYSIQLSGLFNFRYIIVGVVLALLGTPVLSYFSNKSRIWPVLLAFTAFLLQTRKAPLAVLVIFDALEPILIGAFVIWFMQNPSRCTVLRSPVVQWIGMISYSIYLWQQLFTAPSQMYLSWNLNQFSTAVLGVGICATLSFYFIEKPSIRLGRYLSEKLKKRSAPL